MRKILKNTFFKNICVYSFFVIFAVVLLPYFITEVLFGGLNDKDFLTDLRTEEENNIYSPDYEIDNSNKNLSDNISIKEENPGMESYIIGVVAAEMPVSFELEALKAQAVAARTYAYRQIGNSEEINPDNIGQAFITVEEMKKRWGDSFERNYNKVFSAVDATRGEIMVYGGEPILAAFHSTSGGVTENSENVWSEKLSYLQSVDSHEDENAPNFLFNSEFLKTDFKKKFENKGCVFSDNIKNDISITKRTDAGYVTLINIGGKNFKGSEVRSILSLRSTNFTISYKDDKIVFTTKGYGHGAGMSQYGANFMAKENKNYKEILLHYYYGVEFISIKG